MTKDSPTGFFSRLAPAIMLMALAVGGAYLMFVWFWRDNALPVEKQLARQMELAAYGAGRVSSLDYCIPKPGLPACTADLLQNAAPGTRCYEQRCSWGHVNRLYLAGGRLEELPPAVAGLPGLAALNLSHNRLAGLPPEIGRLSSLAELDLSGNLLAELPPEIGQLANLKKLDLSGNRLASLPAELGRLENLSSLNLAGNPLRGPLPGFLTRLPLEKLVYSNTGLCVPVDEAFLGWLSRVATVNGADAPHPTDLCSLAEVDQRAMQALAGLPGQPAGWDPNQIPCAWPGVGCDLAGHVTHLDLSALRPDRLPAELWQLDHLQSLSLANGQLAALPPEIGNLSSLARLDLQGNRLAELPPEIGRLASLTDLNVNDNRLASLPPEIGRLQNLASLTLYGNQLASLPPELGQLTRLALLDVSANPLNGPLPGFLTNLPGVAFVFSNTGLCVPQDEQILAWLGRQARGMYTLDENGALRYAPADPEGTVRQTLDQLGCQ